MSLLINAYTNRRKRKESLERFNYIPFIKPLIIPLDLAQEPNHILGYKSSQSKIIYLSNNKLKVAIKGIRAFWGYMYGLNPSKSPRGISTLLENNIKGSNNLIRGWNIEKEGKGYNVMFIHKPKCIKLLTNNENAMWELLLKIDINAKDIWRISYKDLTL